MSPPPWQASPSANVVFVCHGLREPQMGWDEHPLNAEIVCGRPHLAQGGTGRVCLLCPSLHRAAPGPQHPHGPGSALVAQSCCAESSPAAHLSLVVPLLLQEAVSWVSTFSEGGGGFIQRARGPGWMEMCEPQPLPCALLHMGERKGCWISPLWCSCRRTEGWSPLGECVAHQVEGLTLCAAAS